MNAMIQQSVDLRTVVSDTIVRDGSIFSARVNSFAVNRRTLIFAAIGSALAVAYSSVTSAQTAPPVLPPADVPAGAGERIAIPGARAIDHAGFTVPDLEQAVAFFTDVFGAAVLWRSAPFTADGRGPKAPAGLNADPRALSRLAMLRLGPNLNVELMEYRIPGVSQKMPLASGLNVGHFAFDVDDINRAGDYLRSKKVQMLEGPRHNTEGPNTGQDSWFFLTQWGMTIELVQRPAQMPYEQETSARLFKAPARSDQTINSVSAQNSSSAVEKEILRLDNERIQAMLRRDYAVLERLMAPECVFIESGGTVQTTAEFLANFKTGDSTFDTFVIDENQVRIYGVTAVVTGRYHNAVRTKGQLQPVKRARHTRVWNQQASGQWRMVSHQATEIPSVA